MSQRKIKRYLPEKPNFPFIGQRVEDVTATHESMTIMFSSGIFLKIPLLLNVHSPCKECGGERVAEVPIAFGVPMEDETPKVTLN